MLMNITGIKKAEGGVQSFVFQEEFADVQLGTDNYAFSEPVAVSFSVRKNGSSLMIAGRIATSLLAECCLCLKRFPYRLELEFEDEWVPADKATEEQRDTAFLFEKDEFAIDERIREFIILHLPMRFLCSDGCQGLCSRCGADLNETTCGCERQETDPRLAILSDWNKGV